MDASLSTLANLAEILGAVVVIAGVAFAMIQIQQFRRQRLEVASIELVRSFQSPEFTRAYIHLLAIPEGASAADLRQRDDESEALAMFVSMRFESIGVLVYRRILPIAIVEDLMGGTIVSLWNRLESWVETLRDEHGRSETHEWFQWLADQLRRRATSDPMEPAHVRHRHWSA